MALDLRGRAVYKRETVESYKLSPPGASELAWVERNGDLTGQIGTQEREKGFAALELAKHERFLSEFGLAWCKDREGKMWRSTFQLHDSWRITQQGGLCAVYST